jgi:hypothetical protein
MYEVRADVNAQAGPVEATLEYGTSSSPVTTVLNFDLEERSPIPVTFGSTYSDTFAAEGGSQLFELSVTGSGKIITADLQSDTACMYYGYGGNCYWYDMAGRFYILGDTGTWDDVRVWDSYYGYVRTTSATTLYLVAYDRAISETAVAYDLTVDAVDPWDPSQDLSLVWDPVDDGGQVHLNITNSGATYVYLGFAETAAGSGGRYNEDCLYRYYPATCHYAYGTPTIDLDYVEDSSLVYGGSTTLFDGGSDGEYDAYRANGNDRLTYYVRIYGGPNDGTCVVWGDDPNYYPSYWGCIVL